jgi:hypothetical protein
MEIPLSPAYGKREKRQPNVPYGWKARLGSNFKVTCETCPLQKERKLVRPYLSEVLKYLAYIAVSLAVLTGLIEPSKIPWDKLAMF